ncbi:ankyrin repeat PH and SEC7 domain containing [Micractinium conductrix]|uniref:Ankyrin repeat PH and SEC7 domain containing n=1 Tax=Micractinium conductrix TaxID=554055 RepID=A0A2P6V8B0_9CHLO|nr:ankyrin repeat PH and SEC7 domain containing [Micractinium conductrix]|eukprot:PSC70319.1 ankyrin repeat PH and SEC7 domain containing [Micractinium conductrix]
MAERAQQLRDAAEAGDLQTLRACLKAGADPNAANIYTNTPLVLAVRSNQLGCVQALLAAGADPNLPSRPALPHATRPGCEACIPALLAAGADPAAALLPIQWNPLHYAAANGNTAAVLLLLDAAPATAAMTEYSGKPPLALALSIHRIDAARCLLEHAPLPPASQALALLATACKSPPRYAPLAALQPLYATLVARQPLTPEQWDIVPAPCAGLGAALPAVLERSVGEAALLVQHLPAADKARLRTAALCLRRGHQGASAPLHTPIVWRLLALCVAAA